MDQAMADGRTPLIIAACKGHLDVVDLLAARPALHIAARKGEVEAVRGMLEAEVDLEVLDETGMSALDLAMDAGHTECAAVLESAMLVTWEAATESTSAMESYLRRAAKEGAVQKVASLLERTVVNVLSVDKVRGWDVWSGAGPPGEWARGCGSASSIRNTAPLYTTSLYNSDLLTTL